jgi:hypothetical protein
MVSRCRRTEIPGLRQAGEMPGVHGAAGAARDQLGLALTSAQAFLDPEVLSHDLDRALDHLKPGRVHALQPIT